MTGQLYKGTEGGHKLVKFNPDKNLSTETGSKHEAPPLSEELLTTDRC